MTVTLSPAVQAPHEFGHYKHTRDQYVDITGKIAQTCGQHSTLYGQLANNRLGQMVEASSTEEWQKKREAGLLIAVICFCTAAGFVGAATSNPTGHNAAVQSTINKVCVATKDALQPITTAADTMCKGHQEPTQTRKSVAHTGTQHAHTIESEIDQGIRAMRSSAQQVVEVSQIKV